MWYSAVQTKHSHQVAWEWSLFKKNECTGQTAADQQRELNQHQQLHRQEQQHMHCTEWELYELSALRHIPVWHLHCCCCCGCCCCTCHTRFSDETYASKGFSHTDDHVEEVKKEKKSQVMSEGFMTHFTAVQFRVNQLPHHMKSKVMCCQAIRRLMMNSDHTK